MATTAFRPPVPLPAKTFFQRRRNTNSHSLEYYLQLYHFPDLMCFIDLRTHKSGRPFQIKTAFLAVTFHTWYCTISRSGSEKVICSSPCCSRVGCMHGTCTDYLGSYHCPSIFVDNQWLHIPILTLLWSRLLPKRNEGTIVLSVSA
ncbi:hypothetical protein TNIN_334021 [Trichonephila inaurata madagascariensis]|uniref:Uncharacterized protein n=1 Tax=Trichonephila inaurata madagascariensis TaxID=2747483 RepID=A0A8X7BTZ5_9ARAC|nr:hypothetical protein TNIN_325871 [Trichonephila inaurata madagascariensis]GFY41959.1 hypothetical protein TNIN_334021 [Trichonephila inaurata madagascariensis]